jgi:hypothetical protein
MTSLLIAGGVPSKVGLGEVVKADNGLVVGYHAWSLFVYKKMECVDETTIHFPAETITRQESIYGQESDWAHANNLFYREQSDFDNKSYDETGFLGAEMVQRMGLPPLRVQAYGLSDTLARLEKKSGSMAKEWSKSENMKYNLLKQAYGNLKGVE